MKICEETVRAALDAAVGGETLSQWDKQRIVRTAELLSRRPARRWPRRLVTAAAVMVLSVVCATSVLAATGLGEQLNMLSRQTLEFLRPVNKECEAEGIRAEVIAAMNDGHTAVAYIGLEDVSGQNRLSGQMSFPDCTLADPTWMAYVDNVYYKPDDGSVVLRVIGQNTLEDISGSKVRLSMDNLLSGEQCSTTDTGYTLADIQKKNPQPKLNVAGRVSNYNLSGLGLSDKLYRQLESGNFRTLKAGTAEAAPMELEYSWTRVINAGVVDGVLHILTAPEEGGWYNSLMFGLTDGEGEPLDVSSGVVYLGETYQMGRYQMAEYSQYQEYLLEIPEGYDPEEIHIVCDAVTYETCISGQWDVTFPLEEAVDAITASCNMDMKPWRLTEVSLSLIGITLLGEGSMLENSLTPQVELLLTDGRVIEEFSGSSTGIISADEENEDAENAVMMQYLFDEPIDPDLVEGICINGFRVWSR